MTTTTTTTKITIESLFSGYIVKDETTGKTYACSKLHSYSYDPLTVFEVIKEIEDGAKRDALKETMQ